MGKAVRRRTVLSGAVAAPLIIGRRASAADRSITVGIYTGQQGDVVRKQIIPPFEAKNQCKVYTTEGVTLEQIALMRATRNNPKYSVMFVDDIGVELAKREGLIEQLPREQIPNMERVLKRFIFFDGYGAAFAMSAGGTLLQHRDRQAADQLWRFVGSGPAQPFHDGVAEGDTEPLSADRRRHARDRQTLRPRRSIMIEQAWPKMEALKPNVLSIFESQTTVMQVANGQADVAGLFYSKTVYPYTVKGVPVEMCYPREGTFAGINTVTLVKNAPDRELGIAFINHMLDPAIQKLLAEADIDGANHFGPGVQAGCREVHGVSRVEDGRDADLQS